MVEVAVWKGWKWKKKFFFRARQIFRGDVKWTRKKLPFKNLTIRTWRKLVAAVWKCKKKSPFWNTRARQIIIQAIQLDALVLLTHNLTIIWRGFLILTNWKKNYQCFASLRHSHSLASRSNHQIIEMHTFQHVINPPYHILTRSSISNDRIFFVLFWSAALDARTYIKG